MSQRLSSTVTSREIALYEGQRRALTQIVASMDEGARWILLVGPEGSGKTIILQSLRAELRSTNADTVVCDGFEASEPGDLAIAISGRVTRPMPRAMFSGRRRLAEAIIAGRRSHASPFVVLVDNAQGLSSRSLKLLAEVVRKTSGESGGVWVVLAGAPSLQTPASRAGGTLKAFHCRPAPLTASEVALHVDRQMRVGPDRSLKIPSEAVEAIARYTGGIPGRIDALCDLLVRTPSVRLSSEVSAAVVEEAAARLGYDPSSESSPRGRRDASDSASGPRRSAWRRRVAAFVVIVAALALGALGYVYGLPAARGGSDWVMAWLSPPAPPPPAPPPETAGRRRASRREPGAAVTPSARAPASRAGGERRSGTDRPEAPARGERARPVPPPVSAEQIAALIEGARAGRADDVARLLGAGVSPDVRDSGGVTALMHAVTQGHVEVARALLDKGAQLNARDRGGITSTMLAVINERPDALRFLLDRGADVNARSGSGWTALTFAAWKGDPDLVRVLLKHGANRNVADKQGWTPLDYAAANMLAPPSDLEASEGPLRPPQGGRHAEVVSVLQGTDRP